MFFQDAISNIADYVLFISCLLILAGSILLSFKTRFVQVRHLPLLFKMFWNSLTDRNRVEGQYTILPHKALLTAMSTTSRHRDDRRSRDRYSFGGPWRSIGISSDIIFWQRCHFC